MVEVKGGTFRMGERKDVVTVRSFCLEVNEVTVDRYTACVQSDGCSKEDVSKVSGCNYGLPGQGNHPMNCVDWTQSASFCGAYGHRLPSEEEWEWSARGGARGTTYPWGNAEPDAQLCWSGVALRSGTCATGSLPAGDSPLGIHDLAGNVWEWTASWHDASARVYRGGGWGSNVASGVRGATRLWNGPWNRYAIVGFRCAHNLP